MSTIAVQLFMLLLLFISSISCDFFFFFFTKNGEKEYGSLGKTDKSLGWKN